MVGSGTSRTASQGEPGILVTVIRGHTEEVRQVFKWGEESGRLSVGSRGDWSVAGPGVVPVHLWLSFDGRQLLAASGEAIAYVQGQQLGHDWSPVQDGAELRFGFAMLRVTREATRGPSRSTRRIDPTRLIVGIAASVLLSAALVAALIFRDGSPPHVSAEQAPSSTASAATAPTASTPEALAAPSLAGPELVLQPALDGALPSPPAMQPAPAGDTVGALAATPKPPPAYPQNIANRPIPRVGDQPWLISEEWRAHHERQLHAFGRATAKVIFLGDSITEGWSVVPAYREHFAKYSPFNLGIASDTTQNVLWRIEHGALDGTHPQVVVLMIGINNLAGGFSPQQTADGVRAIVGGVQAHLPAARVLLLGVLPARQDAANPLRGSIKEANQLMQGLAKPGRVELHDLGSVMLEPDGSISKSTMRDFLHPTAEGYERLSQAITPLLDSLMARSVE
jgi:lysophospholipase L1-like esterase